MVQEGPEKGAHHAGAFDSSGGKVELVNHLLVILGLERDDPWTKGVWMDCFLLNTGHGGCVSRNAARRPGAFSISRLTRALRCLGASLHTEMEAVKTCPALRLVMFLWSGERDLLHVPFGSKNPQSRSLPTHARRHCQRRDSIRQAKPRLVWSQEPT